MSKRVFVVGAKRSPIGQFLGTLKDVHPSDLGSQVLKPMLNELNVPLELIDEVVVGNILPAGNGQGIARQISIKAGVPMSVPAYSINMVCGSGMKVVMNAYTSIQSGLQNLVVAGGVESMSRAPFLVPSKARDGLKMGDFSMTDHMIGDALTDAFGGYHMGITAENIVTKYGLTREEQDAFAFHSQEKAILAVDSNRFQDEIQPIEVKTRKETIIFDKDEYPNRSTSLEKLAKLRPAFKTDGSVTAGNSSGINDGASFIILASEEMVEQYQLPVLCEIVGIGQGGVDPSIMGMGPVPAINNCLKHSGLKLNQIELFELNEAFAAQSLGVIRELETQHQVTSQEIMSKCNVNGGAIALGHPVGASGNRITVTLIHEMLKQNVTYGLASLCIGGGMGTAVILKKYIK